jgi:hypothetical protein
VWLAAACAAHDIALVPGAADHAYRCILPPGAMQADPAPARADFVEGTA